MPVNHVWGMRSVNGTDNQFGAGVEVYGNPYLVNNNILSGKIFGYASIGHSFMAGQVLITGNPYINNSVLLNNAKVIGDCWVDTSSVTDNAIITDQAVLKRAHVCGNAKVFDQATVENALIGDETIIKGNAVIKGIDGGVLEIGGYVMLDRGTWNRAPLHFVSKTGLVVCESVDNLININCLTNDIRKILSKAGTKYGRILGMTQEEIDEVQGYAEIIAKETGKCY